MRHMLDQKQDAIVDDRAVTLGGGANICFRD
jgi:hypothetical protein